MAKFRSSAAAAGRMIFNRVPKMNSRLTQVLFLLPALVLFSVSARADLIPVGALMYDVTAPGSTAEFDIVNQTGPNSSIFPDTSFPVSSSEHFTITSLTVDFSDGSTQVFGASYFTLIGDGLSFDGGTIPIGGSNPQPVSATLVGTFDDHTITLNDGSSASLSSPFAFMNSSGTGSPSFSDTPNLVDGDLTVIYASTGGTAPVPEPATWWLMGTFILGLLILRHRKLPAGLRGRSSAVSRSALPLALLVVCLLLVPAASWASALHLNVWTAPDNGVAGVNNANVVGTGFPTGTITPANVQVFLSSVGCFTASTDTTKYATTTGISVKHILGTSDRVNFLVPASLATNTYNVWITDSAVSDADFTSGNCSMIKVTHTSATLSACVPTSSLGLVAPATGPAPVKALVPNACWGCSGTGIQVVQLEAGGGPVVPPASVATASAVNSCAGNPATGEGVCVANNTDVYHLSSTNAVTSLTSGSDATTSFSGGGCANCGVAVNALTNQAVIAMGHSTSFSRSAVQTLNLATNTFGAPFDLHNHVSEDISIDPTRGYILSPNESSNYDIAQFVSATGAITGEFGNQVTSPSLTMDSAAEDCTTGIALTVGEFSNSVFMADLTQATFVPGSPGTWSAPHSTTSIIGSYNAGLSGVTVAPGTGHLAAVTGEFGGSSFSVIQLPATSGTGTPGIVDYAYVQCIIGFSAGFDPHTMSAYTSPNSGKAFAVFASSPPPTELIVADMAGILALPRAGDGHTVLGDPTCLDPAGPVGSTVLRSVATH